jgi:hypothetical protein
MIRLLHLLIPIYQGIHALRTDCLVLELVTESVTCLQCQLPVSEHELVLGLNMFLSQPPVDASLVSDESHSRKPRRTAVRASFIALTLVRNNIV